MISCSLFLRITAKFILSPDSWRGVAGATLARLRGFSCAVIVKASSGPRYVVGCRGKVDKAKLTAGTRVALDMTTLTIMRYLPREVCTARNLRAMPSSTNGHLHLLPPATTPSV